MADPAAMSEERIATYPEGHGPEKHGGEWQLRPWLLAGLLGLSGLLIHFVIDDADDSPWRAALAAFLFFGPLAAAFSLERARWKEVAIFALLAGLVMAGLAWRAMSAGDHYADEQYGFFAGVIATLLALPLFQADFHRKRFATPYRDTHFFVWTDAVGAGGALAFVGATWVMLFVLGALFSLIQIDLLRDAMNEGWFGWTVSGAAFGAALGVLRNHLKLLGTLQSVVMLVLSLLAVPLALGLVLFLLAMIVSGPGVLWAATDNATPVLLACAAGSFVLANAIIRDDDTDMSRSVVMRVTSFVLAMSILPLTAFAAISMGARIAQHGLSPERLWAVVAISVACSYGVAAVAAAIRGKVKGWRPFLRRANLDLAVGLSVFALFLALPILDFGAISAKNQIGRLERGAVAAKDFDYDALRWDFGDAGRNALAKLEKSDNAEVAGLAREAQARKDRPWHAPVEVAGRRDERLANLTFQFDDPALRKEVEEFVRREQGVCYQQCVVLNVGPTKQAELWLAVVSGSTVQYLGRADDGTLQYDYILQRPAPIVRKPADSPANGAANGTESGAEKAPPKVEVRPFNGRQIHVDGKPVGQPFE